MKIVEQSYEIWYPKEPSDWLRESRFIERAGRIAHKSEGKITADSFKAFIKMLLSMVPPHSAVPEFGNMIVSFITDRGITHELVRHRLCSYVQESTRYCNYSKDKFGSEITVIKPSTFIDGEEGVGNQYFLWKHGCEKAEQIYMGMLNNGATPQKARSVLPNSLKTEIVVKANFTEWRHIFKLRAVSKAAHPDMRALMIPLYNECRQYCPEVFDMGDPE